MPLTPKDSVETRTRDARARATFGKLEAACPWVIAGDGEVDV